MTENELDVFEFQDLGEIGQTLRTADEVGPAGVNTLVPDDDASHIKAMQEIRSVLDKHYGDSIQRLHDADKRIVIERVTFKSGASPHIEYRIVEGRDTE